MSLARPGFLNLALSDKPTLHRHYMPFLKGGGLFVPTSKSFNIADEVFVLIQLPEENDKRPVSGRVAWISSLCHASGRPAGIGVQLMETSENENVRNRIDVLLAGIPTDAPTYTL